MARILALYPGPAGFRQRQLVEHGPILAALGIELVLCDDYIDAGDRALFAECVELPPPTEFGGGLERLERWCATRRIDGVLAQSEASLLLGATIGARLGLACIDPAAALLTTSKYLCRAALQQADVPQPAFALGTDAADVRAFAAAHGYPLVLKGVASALARLVTLVKSASEVEPAVERMLHGLPRSVDIQRLQSYARASGADLGCDPTRAFLIESFARGAAVETDGIVFGDDVRSFGVTEQVVTPPPLFFMEGYLLPADRPRGELDAIDDTALRALRALGVRNTGFSVELRFEAGRASIIEVNGRLGWDEGFGDLFATLTGVQPTFQTLQIALGQDPRFQVRADVACALAYQSCYRDAWVERTPGLEELAALSAKHGVRMGSCVYAGERMHAPPHADVSPHVAWALATHPRSSRAAYEIARAAVNELPFGFTSVPAGS